MEVYFSLVLRFLILFFRDLCDGSRKPFFSFVVPLSRLAKTLGQAGEIEPETEGILMEYDVDFSEFSQEVLDCLPKNLPWKIPPEEIRKRRDLRFVCIRTNVSMLCCSLESKQFRYLKPDTLKKKKPESFIYDIVWCMI